MILLLIGFILTFFIEFIIILLILKKDLKKILFYVFLINLFTWPLANLAFSYSLNFYFIELIVILVESILITLLLKLKYVKSLLISFLANFVTALISFFFLSP